jgi:hypothetical protein
VSSLSFRFTDNSERFLQELQQKQRKYGEQSGLFLESQAKKNITEFQHNGKTGYIDTGRARNSITHTYSGKDAFLFTYKDNNGKNFAESIPQAGDTETAKIIVYIGSNVEYFRFLEAGTYKMQASHSLQRAITDSVGTLQTMWIDILKE